MSTESFGGRWGILNRMSGALLNVSTCKGVTKRESTVEWSKLIIESKYRNYSLAQFLLSRKCFYTHPRDGWNEATDWLTKFNRLIRLVPSSSWLAQSVTLWFVGDISERGSMGTDSLRSQDIGFVRGLGRETFQNIVVDDSWVTMNEWVTDDSDYIRECHHMNARPCRALIIDLNSESKIEFRKCLSSSCALLQGIWYTNWVAGCLGSVSGWQPSVCDSLVTNISFGGSSTCWLVGGRVPLLLRWLGMFQVQVYVSKQPAFASVDER